MPKISGKVEQSKGFCSGLYPPGSAPPPPSLPEYLSVPVLVFKGKIAVDYTQKADGSHLLYIKDFDFKTPVEQHPNFVQIIKNYDAKVGYETPVLPQGIYTVVIADADHKPVIRMTSCSDVSDDRNQYLPWVHLGPDRSLVVELQDTRNAQY